MPLTLPRPLIAALVASALVAGCGGGGSGSSPQPVQCASVPSAPTALAATSVTASGLRLDWDAVVAPAGCTVAYSVYQDGAAVANSLASPTAQLTGLSPGTTYQLTVQASDAAGSSAASAALAVATSQGGTIHAGITLTGRLIWHSYVNYGFTGVRSWMADFDAGTVSEITQPRLVGAMNYHFNAAGTEVVFMADDGDYTAAHGTSQWNVWIAGVSATGLDHPTRITPIDGGRYEDPKFSSDGTRIVFKRNLTEIAAIDRSAIVLDGTDQAPAQSLLLANGQEASMPYFLAGSTSDFLYADGSSLDAIRWVHGGVAGTLYQPTGQHAYYPVALDATRFYYVVGTSGTAPDQILLGDTSASLPAGAAFTDAAYEFADPAVLGGSWLAFASTAPGGDGDYDLWIGDFSGGLRYPLDAWIRSANHAERDLGPTFHGTISP